MKKRQKTHVMRDMPMPISHDPPPLTPPPTRTIERLGALERRVDVLEAVLKGYGPPPRATPQAPVEGLPPAVLRNYAALHEWMQPDRWRADGTAEEQLRTRTMLEHLASLIQVAASGGDVPRP